MKQWFLSFLVFLSVQVLGQDSAALHNPPSARDKKRQQTIAAITAAGYGGSFLFLSQAWYKDYPRRTFHTFNDLGEWLQVDKAGHAWTTYHTSRFTTNMWRWAGVADNKALLLGTGSSLLYMLSIEYLDGHSAEWGWSWGDVGSNFLGASLYASQELLWRDQKIGFKFSAHTIQYAEPTLKERANALFGSSFQGRLLKDYNAQTYWMSANIRSFFSKTTLPGWLNVAVGYGADGLFGGYENLARDKSGNITFDRRDIKRYRQWYLAPDVDLTKIKTRSKLLQAVFSALNVLKFPTPALQFSKGRFQVKALAY